MRKVACLLIGALSLHAQTGDGAVASSQTDWHWQNWTFMATAFVTATAAIVYIAYNNGHHAPNQ